MKWQAGDVLAFYGTDWLSRLISLATFGGPSHVGIVCEYNNLGWVLVESISECKRQCLIANALAKGCQVHYPEARIADYALSGARCELWRLTPQWALRHERGDLLTEILIDQVVRHHDPYDLFGAALSWTRLSHLTDASYHSFFCSALAAWGLMRVGRIPINNPRLYSPAGLIRQLRRTGVAKKSTIYR